MADARSELWHEVARILAEQRPRWFFGENVPGLLSVNGGRDFGAVLGCLAELGYGFAYRVLDAQFFGVPQRRRRVFIIGCLGDWRGAAEVLFERESVPLRSAPLCRARNTVAKCLARGSARGGYRYEGSEDYVVTHSLTGESPVGAQVRRLTPMECERLQGFPDDWTALGCTGERIADGARYQMIGNAVAVPVVEWIAHRMRSVDAAHQNH